jgi:hypothetical protein
MLGLVAVISPSSAKAADDTAGGAYRAVLRGGIVHADAGAVAGPATASPTEHFTSGSLLLELDSARTGRQWGWDASMSFDFGRQPVLMMVKTPTSAATAAYRDAWITSQSFRFTRASRAVQTAVIGRVGAARIDAAGAELGWFDRDVARAGRSAHTLDPLMQSYVGIRHDQRFHRAGDLSAFDDPTGRVFFGFAVSPIRMKASSAEHASHTVLSAGGGFEFEGAVRGPTRLPSGFKIVATVNVDLRPVLRR